MSIFKVSQHTSEQFSLETNPSRTFSSSSSGATGSVYVFPRRSPFEKETNRLSPFNATTFDDENIESVLMNALSGARDSSVTDINPQMSQYMSMVNSKGPSRRKQQVQSILRFEPSFKLTSDTLRT